MTNLPEYNYPPRPAPRPRRTRTPVVTYALIGLCVLVFLGQMLGDALLGADIVAFYGMKINELILEGQLWRLITPMFLHGSLVHIAFNMYALYILGSGLEHFYGHSRYLLLFLVSGFAGNVMSFLFSANPSLGASTAVFGLAAAQTVFIYRNRQLFANARNMLTSMLMVVAVNLFLGLSPGIDNWGHLGGLIGGLLIAWFGGPAFEVEPTFSGYQARDLRTGHTLPVAIVVALFFAGAAATRFF